MRASTSTLPVGRGSTHANPDGVERRSGGDRRRAARATLSAAPPPDVAKPRTRAIFFDALKAAGVSQKAAAITLEIDPATLSRMATGDPMSPGTPKLTTEIIDRARVELGDQFRAEFNRRMAAEYGIGGDEPLVDAINCALAILDKLAAAQLAGKVA